MYESDEWYVQYDLASKAMKWTMAEGRQTLADTDDQWDLDASASDNESYDIESDGSQLD